MFKRIALVSLILAALVLSVPAQAKDVAGHLGLGVDNNVTASSLGIGTNVKSSSNSTDAPSAGLSLKYWINNDWAVAGVLGFMYATSGATKSEDSLNNDKSGIWGLTFDLKGIYNFAKSENANFGAFADFSVRKESATNARPKGPYHSNLGLAFAFGFTPEVFLTDSFALTAEFGLTFRLQNGFGVGLGGDNLLGGLGFHYYF